MGGKPNARTITRTVGKTAATAGGPAGTVASQAIDIVVDTGDTFGIWRDLGESLSVLLFWLVFILLIAANTVNPATWWNHLRNVMEKLDRLPGVEMPFINSSESGSTEADSTSDTITRLRRAIIGQESGGDFSIVNTDSGALGYGQLMPYNVAPWTQEALGRSLTTTQFLNSPQAQIQTIDHKLQQYWEEAAQITPNEDIIVRRVAAKWYSGRPELWSNTRPQYYNGNRYPSIAQYTASILAKFQSE